MKENIYKDVSNILKTSINGNQGFHHLNSVATLCCYLGHQRHLDIEIAYLIGILHDISYYKEGIHQDHALKSSQEAKKILTQYHENHIDIIVQAIKNHSDKDIFSSYPYDELIKDADLLSSYYDEPDQIFSSLKQKRLDSLIKE